MATQAVMTEEMRLALRLKCQKDLYFFARAVVGFREMVPHLHGEIARVLMEPIKRKLILAPRGHFKSSLCTISYPTWLIINNPNIRIILMNATATNAEHFLRRIQAIFEKNEMFRMLFPELIPQFDRTTKWSATEMLVNRTEDYPEATIETLGVGGKAASRHYNVQIKDDLVNEEIAESEQGMAHVIAHHQYSEGLFDNPDQGIDLVVGTRWSYADYYQHIMDTESDYFQYIRSAIENGVPIFPERFNLEGLARIQRKQGPYKFSTQYLNNPADESVADFKGDWIEYYWIDDNGLLVPEYRTDKLRAERKPVRLDTAFLHVYAQVDPAITEDKRKTNASRTAITIEGIDSKGNIYILEAWADMVDPVKLIDKIFELQEKWKPIQWGIEAVAYQRALKPIIEKIARETGKYLNIRDLNPKQREKDARIRGLQGFFFDHRVFIRRGMMAFVDEYISFPVGRFRDLLDAFSYGPDMWTLPESDAESEEEEEALNAFQRSVNPVTGY